MIQLIKGFKDILPGEVERWQHMEKIARGLFEDFGFTEIRLPIMERTELFKRSIGEDTDIVEKEMYTFTDRNGGQVTLRPEATASVVRSYIQHKLYAKNPVRKLYTIGPMFRRERPQKGRYRQFYQINAEVFGIASPLMDAQLIFMLMTFFKRLSIDSLNVHINSLGCPECRPAFHDALSEYLASVHAKLCEDCARRGQQNPLRTLDCKVPSCKEAMARAPLISGILCPECSGHMDTVKESLHKQGVDFVENSLLVRGLDYYTRTTFEVQTDQLGAQNAIAGGGRYDGLVKELGGPEQPAVGFAIGCDRLLDVLSMDREDLVHHPDVFIAALGSDCMKKAYEWVCELNLSGIKADMDFTGKSLKSQMKTADRMNAAYVLIAGENELKEGTAVLRNMKTKEQVSVRLDNAVKEIKSKVQGTGPQVAPGKE